MHSVLACEGTSEDMSALFGLGSFAAVQNEATAWILRLRTPGPNYLRAIRARAMMGLNAPGGAERVSWGIGSFGCERESVA